MPDEPTPDLTRVPAKYLDFKEVFNKSKAMSLPPHRLYDCAIDLHPGTFPPKGCLFSLTAPEREAMNKCIHDSLASALIRPSSSPTGAGFFCVEKGLNDITIKNRYPLPLIATAFQLLQGATIFSKLNLHNAYHLVRIKEWDEWKTAFNTSKTSTLTALTSSKTPFLWTSTAGGAFKTLKLRFTSAPILQVPNPDNLWCEVDTSDIGVGGVLSQRLATDQKLHPCAFFSRSPHRKKL